MRFVLLGFLMMSLSSCSTVSPNYPNIWDGLSWDMSVNELEAYYGKELDGSGNSEHYYLAANKCKIENILMLCTYRFVEDKLLVVMSIADKSYFDISNRTSELPDRVLSALISKYGKYDYAGLLYPDLVYSNVLIDKTSNNSYISALNSSFVVKWNADKEDIKMTYSSGSVVLTYTKPNVDVWGIIGESQKENEGCNGK